MRWRDILVWIVCAVVAGGLFGVAGSRLDSINAKRKEMKLVQNEPLENAPPSLAFATVAMGAFRGLVVDILWLRADALKEQGQYFDAKQLAEWITMLQPRFASVWEFHAWNMAYNISVAIPASQPDQRWHWVKNGYELLRDKGIPLNPKSLELYRELAWIFQHKMGGITDDAQKFYKVQFAREIGPLVESADNGLFEALAKAPAEWNQIAADPNASALIAAFKAADPAFAESDGFANRYMALVQDPNRSTPAARQVLDSYRGTPVLERFDVTIKAYQLRHVWKMDPVLMLELNRRYGPVDFNDPNHVIPLDWRHPDSHAIYWAAKGLQIAAQNEGRPLETAELNTDRIIMHSLQHLFQYGRLFFFNVEMPAGPDAPAGQPPMVGTDVFLRPDLRMFDRYHQVLMALMDKYQERDSREESLGAGYRNMLKNAVLSFYQSGLVSQAQRIYKQLGKENPDITDFNVPLVEFCRKQFLEDFKGLGIYDATEQIMGLLKESYYLYAIQSDDESYGRETLAQQIRDYYQKQYGDENRLALPEMRYIRYTALIDFLQDPQYPPYLRQGLMDRMKAERPELFKQLEQTDQESRKKAQEQQPSPGAVPKK